MKKRRLKKLFENLNNIQELSTLSDTEEHYDNKCSICLEIFKEKTKPLECRHIYCNECIMAWTKFSNVCPLCKIEMSMLLTLDSEDRVIN